MRRLAAKPAARADIRNLLAESDRVFGPRSRAAYAALINRAITLLREKPDRAGVRQRDDLFGAPSLCHLRHARPRGAHPNHPRHIIIFVANETTLTIIRVLHEAMDIETHLTPSDAP